MNTKHTETQRKLTRALMLLLTVCLGSVQSTMAVTLNFFSASTYSADTALMDQTLGINGFLIEDFEATSLLNGLSLTYTGNSFNTTQSSLPRILVFSGGWDGIAIASNDPNNNTPANGVYPALTTFTYGPGASSLGIGLGGFQSLNPSADEFR